MPNEAPAPAETDNVDNALESGETVTPTPTPALAPTESDWRAALPEEIRDNATLGKIKSVDALASSYINLQAHLGRDKITKPVSEEDWNSVYDFLGRPEKPDAYEVELSEELPDQVKAQFTDEALGEFKSEAHKLGLTTSQLQGVVGWYAQNLSGQYEAMAEMQGQSIEQAEQALHDKWGRAYEQNLGFAKSAFEEYGGEELAGLMEQSGLGNNPIVLEAFANIAKKTMADKDLAGRETARSQILTPEEARSEAASIMSHPAYTDRHHPEHAAMVKKVQQLFEKAYD